MDGLNIDQLLARARPIMKGGVMGTSSTAAAAVRRLSETKDRFPPKSPRDNITCCKCKGPNHMAKDQLSHQKTKKRTKCENRVHTESRVVYVARL